MKNCWEMNGRYWVKHDIKDQGGRRGVLSNLRRREMRMHREDQNQKKTKNSLHVLPTSTLAIEHQQFVLLSHSHHIEIEPQW